MENIEIIEIDENSLEIDEFYQIYGRLFPRREEVETVDNIKKYLSLKKTGFYGKNNYHILILKLNNKVIGFIIGDYYFSSGISFIEFIGIDSSYVKRGYSKILIEKFLDLVKEDSARSNSILNGILIEVEKPESIDSPGSFPFWDHMGFKKIECKYVQPPLSDDKEPAKDLMLMYLGIYKKNLDKRTLISAVMDYFKYAMSKEDPSQLEELKILEDSINTDYVVLTKLGSSWFIHPRIRYFYSVDIGDIFSEKINFLELLDSKWKKKAVAIGQKKISNESIEEIHNRIERDKIDFSSNYLENRYIIRGVLDLETPKFITYSPHETIRPNEKIPAEIKILYSFNSIGILTIEFIINVKTTVSTGTLIYLENSSGVYIMEKQLKNYIREIITESISIKEKNVVDVDPYPFIFIPEYGGELTPPEIYGITEIDPSYWEVSSIELRNHSKMDISIVSGIQVYYEFLSSLVVSENKNNYIENIEEIAGIQIADIPSNENIEETALSIVEAEYSVEVERLRVQYVLLYTLFKILEGKNITTKYTLEYGQLLEFQKKLIRKLDEIMLVDTEKFPSLKRIFKNAQERLGITELKSKIVDIQNSIKEEIQVRSGIAQTQKGNVLNILIFLLILIQFLEPFPFKSYGYIRYAIVLIPAAVLIYSFIIKK